MAHYDCKNCGYSGGVAFGYCEECTTEDYRNTQKEIEKLGSELVSEYNDRVKPILEEMERERRFFVSENPVLKALKEQLALIRIRETGK